MTQTLRLEGHSSTTEVYLQGKLEEVGKLVPQGAQPIVITDREVWVQFKDRMPTDWPVYQVVPGEVSKSLRTASNLYRYLQEQRADRSAFLVGLGGGVVSDLTGFVAATYLRGVSFGLVPTTLLAQADAAIGGKSALNLYGFKNVVGTIYQPRWVLEDHSLLGTLSEAQVESGLAEIVKLAILEDPELYARLGEHADDYRLLTPSYIEPTIAWAVRTKMGYIEADEQDYDVRRRLNLGHTWGHAVEAVTGLPHGHAVAIGLVFAAELGEWLQLSQPGLAENIAATLVRLGLPTRSKALPWVLFEALQRDKKRQGDAIGFIVPLRIGEAKEQRVELAQLKEFVQHVYAS